MKKIIKIIPFTLLFTFAFFGGCDKFESLPLNVPIRVNFEIPAANSSYTTIVDFEKVSETYRDNIEKIKDLSYIKASLNIDSVSSDDDLSIDIEIRKSDNTPMITYTINNFKAANYQDKAYEIQLDQDKIIALDYYLENVESNNKLIVVITVTGLTETQYISGYLDVVLEADTEL